MVPDPVALGELLEQGQEESQVFTDQQGDLMLGWIQTGCRLRLGIFGRWRVDFFGKDMLKDESAVVPDGIVFGVLGEQSRRQAERLGSVLLRFDLDMFLASSMAECLEGHTFACSLSTRAWYASICLSSFLRAASVFSLTATRGTPCCREVNVGQPASSILANSHS